MKAKRSIFFAFCAAGMLGLAGCGSPGPVTGTVTSTAASASIAVSTVQTDANAAIAVAQGALTAYEATSNPSQSVITKAKSLLAAAQTDVTTYGAYSAEAIAAAAVFANYLLTSAPGNGVTPASS